MNTDSMIAPSGLCRFSACMLMFASVWLVADRALPQSRIEPREKWSAVFAQSKVPFTFDVRHAAMFTGRLSWIFSVGQRTIVRGESPVDGGPDKPSKIVVPLQIPPVKDGIILETKLTLMLHGQNDSKAVTTLKKPIRIFPADPFAGRTESLRQRRIALFDPKGDTAELFKKARIPCTQIRNAAALEDWDGNLLIIGEGISLADYRALPEILLDVAAAGVPVLCLAPVDGSIPLPSTSDLELPLPRQMLWKRKQVITDLDKRLDGDAWPQKPMIAGRLTLDSRRGRISAVIDKSQQGWPWLELCYAKPGTKRESALVVCCFAIVQNWDAGPTPRYLLARIIDRLTLPIASPPTREGPGEVKAP